MFRLFGRTCAAIVGGDVYLHGHAVEIGCTAIVAAPQGDGLFRVAGNADADQVAVADNAVRGIEFHPAGAGQINLTPGVGRSAAEGRRSVAISNIDIAGDEARSEPQCSGCLHRQQSEIPAGAAPKLQGLERRLRSVFRPPGVNEALMDGVAHRHQQVTGLGGLPDPHELPCPFVDRLDRDSDA